MCNNVYKGEKRPYELENGSVWNMPTVHCVFCRHCKGLFYDSAGPYMFVCDKDLEITTGECECSCKGFEDSGYVFDEEEYKKKMWERVTLIASHKKLLETDPEYKQQYENAWREICNKVFYGL